MLVISALSIGARMDLTSEGVGVRGGALDFMVVRRLFGVLGKAGFLKLTSVDSVDSFDLRCEFRAFLDGACFGGSSNALRFCT